MDLFISSPHPLGAPPHSPLRMATPTQRSGAETERETAPARFPVKQVHKTLNEVRP